MTIQAQILDLFDELRQRLGMWLILIAHDLDGMARTAHRVRALDRLA